MLPFCNSNNSNNKNDPNESNLSMFETSGEKIEIEKRVIEYLIMIGLDS